MLLKLPNLQIVFVITKKRWKWWWAGWATPLSESLRNYQPPVTKNLFPWKHTSFSGLSAGQLFWWPNINIDLAHKNAISSYQCFWTVSNQCNSCFLLFFLFLAQISDFPITMGPGTMTIFWKLWQSRGPLSAKGVLPSPAPFLRVYLPKNLAEMGGPPNFQTVCQFDSRKISSTWAKSGVRLKGGPHAVYGQNPPNSIWKAPYVWSLLLQI